MEPDLLVRQMGNTLAMDKSVNLFSGLMVQKMIAMCMKWLKCCQNDDICIAC